MRLYLVGISNLVVEVDASYIKGMLSNPDVQLNAAINCWIATILLFNFKLAHIPADKHKGPNRLSRCKSALGEEENDDPKDWVNNVLSLGLWVVSWIDTFPTDAHYTDALVLSLEVNTNNDKDFTQYSCPHCNCRLPMQYHTGDLVLTNPPCTLSHL